MLIKQVVERGLITRVERVEVVSKRLEELQLIRLRVAIKAIRRLENKEQEHTKEREPSIRIGLGIRHHIKERKALYKYEVNTYPAYLTGEKLIFLVKFISNKRYFILVNKIPLDIYNQINVIKKSHL